MDRKYILGRDAVPAYIRLGEGESLRMTLFAPEGTSCELSLEIDLDGEGASLDLAGGFRCLKDEKLKFHVLVRHNVPGCSSRQLFKGVVDGSANASFEGLVLVAEGAVRTVAHQEVHSLLMSSEATAQARPQLEIHADDVECSHGATTGYLNPEELFYMRSRGIPEELARAMQTEAFLQPIISRMA